VTDGSDFDSSYERTRFSVSKRSRRHRAVRLRRILSDDAPMHELIATHYYESSRPAFISFAIGGRRRVPARSKIHRRVAMRALHEGGFFHSQLPPSRVVCPSS